MCGYSLLILLFGSCLLRIINYDPWLCLFRAGVSASLYVPMEVRCSVNIRWWLVYGRCQVQLPTLYPVFVL